MHLGCVCMRSLRIGTIVVRFNRSSESGLAFRPLSSDELHPIIRSSDPDDIELHDIEGNSLQYVIPKTAPLVIVRKRVPSDLDGPSRTVRPAQSTRCSKRTLQPAQPSSLSWSSQCNSSALIVVSYRALGYKNIRSCTRSRISGTRDRHDRSHVTHSSNRGVLDAAAQPEHLDICANGTHL